MKHRIVLFFALAIAGTGLSAKDWYAAPTASTSGNGSLTNPWPLFVALQSSSIQAGDTLYLRGGNYQGPGFASTLSGTSNNYVTVRSYPCEWASITAGSFGTLLTTLTPSTTANVTIGGSENWVNGTVVVIDSENMYLNGKGGTNWSLVRPWNGTTATNHSINTRVDIAAAFIEHTGNYVRFMEFEIDGSLITNRNVNGSYSGYLGDGLDLSADGHGNKAINLIIHNVGHPGIGFWQQGAGGEINGCIIWGVGFYDYSPDYLGAPRGSGIYSQNSAGTAVIKNTLSFRNFTTGMKVFGETGPVLNFTFDGNWVIGTAAGGIEVASGSTSMSNIVVIGNFIYGHPMLSYVSVGNTRQYFVNNIVVAGAFNTSEFTQSVYTNNTVFMPKNVGAGDNANAVVGYSSTLLQKSQLSLTWDYNTYYLGNGSSPYNWGFGTADVSPTNSLGGGTLKFSNDNGDAWRDWSGYDAHSSYGQGWPTNFLRVQAMRLDYDTNRHYVAVVSTSGQTNVPLNLSALGYIAGDRYELRDAQNYFTVVSSGRYGGGAITLPLNLTNVAPITGNITHYTNLHSNIKDPGLFNAFVLRRIPGVSQSLRKLSNNAYQIFGNGLPGLAYQVQAATNITSPNWQPLSTATGDLSGAFMLIDSNGPLRRFYRLTGP